MRHWEEEKSFVKKLLSLITGLIQDSHELRIQPSMKKSDMEIEYNKEELSL